MERRKLLAASPGTLVYAAAKLMTKHKVSAIVVVEKSRLVGIFTERDAVSRVIAKGRDPRATALAAVMTKNPQTVDPDESLGYALLQMYEKGFRHMPVVDGGVPIGIISARKALDPELEEFESEAERRRSISRRARVG
jgi:CBS domain-containing protein